jgi:hypothetical protein
LATQMKRDELMRLARVGAVERIAELRREIASLEAMVGEMPRRARATARGSRARTTPRGKKREAPQAAPAPRRAASSWSAAARKAVSLRMKKYWAARRQSEKG